MTEVRTKLLNDLIEEGFEIVETEGTDKYWLVGKDKLSFVWPVLISKVRKVTKGLINYEGENEETNEMEWLADDFRIETPIFDEINKMYLDAAAGCYFCDNSVDPNAEGFNNETPLCFMCRLKLMVS